MAEHAPADFTRKLIDELSKDRFRLRAWRRFLTRAWQRSLDDIRQSLPLTGSFLWSALGVASIGVIVLLVSWRMQSGSIAIQSLLWWLPWYIIAVAFVLTHLGMADDGSGHRSNRFTAPNLLSFARLALAPLILLPGAALAMPGLGGLLFAGFAICLALTDVLDGWMARRMQLCTRLGRMLDYLADIAFMTFLSIGLYVANAIPVSLLWLMILRGPVTCLSAIVLYFVRGPAQFDATTVSRAMTVVLSIGLLMIAFNVGWSAGSLSSPWFERGVQGLHVLAGANVVYFIRRGVIWNRRQSATAHVQNSL